MERLKPKCVLNIEAELGEHPLWSVDDACLYWLDIEKSTINRFVPGTGENTHWTLPAVLAASRYEQMAVRSLRHRTASTR